SVRVGTVAKLAGEVISPTLYASGRNNGTSVDGTCTDRRNIAGKPLDKNRTGVRIVFARAIAKSTVVVAPPTFDATFLRHHAGVSVASTESCNITGKTNRVHRGSAVFPKAIPQCTRVTITPALHTICSQGTCVVTSQADCCDA